MRLKAQAAWAGCGFITAIQARGWISKAWTCFQFSPELTREWRWSERYAAQDELLRYLNFVADRFDLRRHILFNTTLARGRWRPAQARYELETADGRRFSCRFLVLATGNLSAARAPPFPGLTTFEGEWVQTAQWPEREVRIADRRVAVIGTGSSGVQAITAIAPQAKHLYVFQRTPNFSVPARNAPLAEEVREAAITANRREVAGNAGASRARSRYLPMPITAPRRGRRGLRRNGRLAGRA